jgi:hypothetical protein
MVGDVTTADLLTRLEAMAARLGAMAAQLDEQRMVIDRQSEEIARLTSAVSGAVRTSSEPARTTTRRGLLKGAMAAGVAVTALAVARARPAYANDPNDVARGATNEYTGATTIVVNADTTTPAFAAYSKNMGIDGVGQRNGTGIRGSSNAGDGPDLGGSGIGVEGVSGAGTGVHGKATGGVGVRGESTSYIGVRGESRDHYGMFGSSTTNVGVLAESEQAEGVWAFSSTGIGVYSRSKYNYGIEGVTQSAAYAGLVGVGTVSGSAGFYALGAVPGATAGTFQGNVIINGSLTVTGSYPKSAAVKKRDGTQVRMYCQESPEPWFEDFGTATLANGQAAVALDPEFDEVVNGNDYRVFLTEIGDCGGLYVSRKGPHRFEVRSRTGASAGGSFDYRVVARRRDDVGKRLEKVEIPTMAPIDVEKLTRPETQPPATPRPHNGAR